MHTPSPTQAETPSGLSKSTTQPVEAASMQTSHTHTLSDITTLTNNVKTSLNDREVLASEDSSVNGGGREVPRLPRSHTPREGLIPSYLHSPLRVPSNPQPEKHVQCHAGRMISSASPKRSIAITAESNKSPKTSSHMELEDADLLDYDKDDNLSTVHEVGIEEDLEDPEIPSEMLPRPMSAIEVLSKMV